MVPLESLRISDRSRFGGKATRLGELIRAGLQVPRGYAISSELCSEWLSNIGLSLETEYVLSHNEEIIQRIGERPLTSALCDRLDELCSELAGDGATLAVRSSAPHEDTQEASFAGVYESYTELEGTQEVSNALKNCYASLFTSRALVLCLENGLDLRNMGMAVIVQRFAPGAPSGVLFTADAVSMVPDVMVLHAVDGPCADFVDGRRAAAQIRVNRNTGEIISRSEPEGAPHLETSQIESLRSEAMHVEEILGEQQDIEWTLQEGVPRILQTRPLTTFRHRVNPEDWKPEDGKTWELDHMFAQPPLKQEVAIRKWRSAHLSTEQTGMSAMHKLQLFREGYVYYRAGDIADIEGKRKRWADYVTSLFAQGKNIFQDVLLPQIQERQKALDTFVGRRLSNSEAARFFSEALQYAEHMSETHWKAVWGTSYVEGWGGVPHFRAVFKEELAGLTESEYRDLVYLPGCYTEERRALIEMAEQVRADAELAELFDKHPYDRVLYAHLGRIPGGKRLQGPIDSYLQRFGLYPAGGWQDPVGPVLKEKPELVLGRIRPYMHAERRSFESSIEGILEHKRNLVGRITRDMTAERCAEFEGALVLAEKSFLTRDDHSHFIDLTNTSYLRLATCEASRLLAEAGVLRQPQDIWLLTGDEILADLTGESTISRDLVEQRRSEHRHRLSLLPPEFLGPPPVRRPPDRRPPVRRPGSAAHPDRRPLETVFAESLSGISGLPRTVKGRVRKIESDPFVLDAPCILVIPDIRAVDIVPHLRCIIGLIVASGSPLSHLGIIARELGIPALFEVRGAMQALHDGDTVLLDGVEERVTIIEKASQQKGLE